MYKNYFKRVLDFFVSFLGFLFLLPIFLIIFVILFIVNNKKPFFFQSRPGKNEEIFKIIKFKTMNDKKDNNGKLLPADKRITKTGNFLRKTSFDEIPQLINVIKGDMSLIGPRPLLVKYLLVYNEDQKRRHDVKPGITGLAQVNGRNAISWKEKFEYDIEYVDNMSLLLDIKIILLTIKKVVGNEDIYNDDNTIVPDFTGTPTQNKKLL